MKPNLPRSWFSLPKKEQQAITQERINFESRSRDG